MNCFGVFIIFFVFFLTILVVHAHHDHPVTTVLTHYSSMARYSLFVLKVPLNTNQPTYQTCKHFMTIETALETLLAVRYAA